MPEAKILQSYAFFVREGVASSARETRPSSFSSYGIGTVMSVQPRNTSQKIVIERAIGGMWRVWDVKREEDKQEFTLTVGELTEQFWKLLNRANPTLAAGTANFVPGSAQTCKGWLQIQTVDEAGNRQNTLELWVDVEITTQDLGRGVIQAQLEVTKIYSTLNSGTVENITY